MAASARSRLDELLEEGRAGAVAREQAEFDRLAGPFEQSIVLFGARKMGRKVLAGLRRVGIEPLAFSDNNAELWGTSIDGVPVMAPADAARELGRRAVFVITIWGSGSRDTMRGRARKLRELGCERVAMFGHLFWKYAGVFLPDYAMDVPHKVHEQSEAVRSAFATLADERSRLEFLAQLEWRLRFDFDVLPDPEPDPIYFARDIVRLSDREVFVDCGAYDGDTLLAFSRECGGTFRGAIAVEPDAVSVARLRQTIMGLPADAQERIRIVEAAAGASEGVLRFSATGGLDSSAGAGSAEVRCTTLDGALEGEAVTFIKMDIEGAEPDALIGARETLRSYAPVLAVCSYHAQDHLWRIPNLIHELQPDYLIYLRPHIQLVEDLVCYAAPRVRRVA